MKNIILLVSLVLFVGCEQVTDYDFDKEQDGHNIKQIGYHPVYRNDIFNGLNDPIKCGNFIHDNISYEYIKGQPTKSPREIWETKTANCVEYSLLFDNIMYINTYQKWNIVAVNSSLARSIVSGGEVNHSAVEYSGNIYSAKTGSIVEYEKIGYIYSFDSFLYDIK